MLTEIYIEALLVDEALADEVWEYWDKGEIDDQVAWLVWWLISSSGQQTGSLTQRRFTRESQRKCALRWKRFSRRHSVIGKCY